MKPIELLQTEVVRLERARESSFEQLGEGKINFELHEQHMRNLNPLIEEYKYIIRVINQYA